MNYSDRVTKKEYWEQQLAGYARVMAGTYVGNGYSSQFISLGITPKAVMIWRSGIYQCTPASQFYGGAVVTGFSFPGLRIEDGGFRVLNAEEVYRLNEGYSTFVYIALF